MATCISCSSSTTAICSHELEHPVGASLPEDLLAFGGLFVLGVALGRVVSVNQFSLHGMYRDRLVRTFIGSSRQAEERRPSPFTGFDAQDDMRISCLAALGRPLHVVNTTLNLVAENTLATQERKSTTFTISPLHAGSRHVGYRPAAAYAGGLTLGEALTTSGAAVSPNMGAESSPALTFLLALFNARLGVWAGNPGPAGKETWTRTEPRFGVKPILNELLGRTSDRNPYVYLSDGGHFENLGLYEMVLRRCRYIVACDAGCDPQYRVRGSGQRDSKDPAGLRDRHRFSGRSQDRADVARAGVRPARLTLGYRTDSLFGGRSWGARRRHPVLEARADGRRAGRRRELRSRRTRRSPTSRRRISGSTRHSSRAIGCSACTPS